MSEDELRAAAREGLRLYEEKCQAERAQMSFWEHVEELWAEAPWVLRVLFFMVGPVLFIATTAFMAWAVTT